MVVGGQQQNQVLVIERRGCCPDAIIDCSESMATVILILNVLSPGLGTLISSCVDRNGCNCSAFFLAWCQAFLTVVCFLGWVMSIFHGVNVFNYNKGKV